jgi:hypothetical protein
MSFIGREINLQPLRGNAETWVEERVINGGLERRRVLAGPWRPHQPFFRCGGGMLHMAEETCVCEGAT